jgi:hypothetical protein
VKDLSHGPQDPLPPGLVAEPLSAPGGRFGRRPLGNVSGAMYAEYVIPESVPDVPAMPDAPPDMPGIPADPTPPGGDPEPMDIAA